MYDRCQTFLAGVALIVFVSCASLRHPDETTFRGQKPDDDSLVYTREAYQTQYTGDFAGLSVYALVRALVDPSWNRQKKLGGRCSVMNPEVNLMLPCPATPIVLRNQKGSEIFRMMSDAGKFEFKVESGKEYWVTVEPTNSKLAKNSSGPFKSGDYIELTLKRQ